MEEQRKRVSLHLEIDLQRILEAYAVARQGLVSMYRVCRWPYGEDVRRCIWNHVPSDPILTFIAIRTAMMVDPLDGLDGVEEEERINNLSVLLWLLAERVLEIQRGAKVTHGRMLYKGRAGTMLPEDPDE